MLFLEKLQINCQQLPDKVALEFVTAVEPQLIRYAELETAVSQTIAYLQSKGVQPGDRVAMQLPKSLPFIYLHLAIMRMGAISLPLNPGYPARELAYYLKDAAVKLFFADETRQEEIEEIFDSLPELEECVFLDGTAVDTFNALISDSEPEITPDPVHADDTCLMIYTSGTTGRPKGAMLSHGNLTANLNSLHEAWGWQESDVILHVLPIFHVHGLVVALHAALNAGATAVLHPKFDAQKVIAALQEPRFTVFMAVPTIHRRLLDLPELEKYSLRHMRLVTSGSDRLPDHVFKAYQDNFGQTLLERYGMSETSMLISNPLHGERRVGSVGLPLPGVEVRIVNSVTEEPLPDEEVGDVQVRGANVTKGYWRQPEKTAAAFTPDGWLRTGDLGMRGSDGYFTLKGRSKDLVISGGYNVYPPEVELVLADHPDLKTSVVIGCPDDEWGERVTAVVVPHPAAQITAEEIINFCKARLVNYKVPRQIVFISELPRTALGKVQKAILRQQFCDSD